LTAPGSSPSFTILKAVVQQVDPAWELLGADTLSGGISANVWRLTVQQSVSAPEQWIMRWHDGHEDTHHSSIVEREYHLIDHLNSLGLPVPNPIQLDTSSEIVTAPFLILKFVEGETNFSTDLVAQRIRPSAETLAAIHRVPLSHELLALLPRQLERIDYLFSHQPDQFDEAVLKKQLLDLLMTVWPLPQTNLDVLLHGDFWPGNWLWNDGRLVAVIDWEDAALGDPLYDLAIARLEMVFTFGLGAMDAFTAVYLDAFTAAYPAAMPGIDLENLPYWDLVASLRPLGNFSKWAPGWIDVGRPDITEETMRAAHQAFTEQALWKLGRI